MKTNNPKQEKRIRLKRKIRAKVSGTKECPRLSVFKSNLHIYAQMIDDTTGTTLLSAHDKNFKGTYRERAVAVGKEIANLAGKAGITKAVFDRNGYKYTGHIAALADSAREGGLTF